MATGAHWHGLSPSWHIRGSPDAPSCSSPNSSCGSYLTHLQRSAASQHSSEQLHPLVYTVSTTRVIGSSSRVPISHNMCVLHENGGTGSCALQVTAERVTCDTALGECPSTEGTRWPHALHRPSHGISPHRAQLQPSGRAGIISRTSEAGGSLCTRLIPQGDHLQDLHRHLQLARLLQALSCWGDLLLLVSIPRHHLGEQTL